MTASVHLDTAFARQWQDWHTAHEQQRTAPHGVLAVTHLHWLGEAPTALEGAPGRWWVRDDVVRVRLGPGDSLLRDGVELNTADGAELAFGPIAERDGLTLGYGTTVLELAKRGGAYLLRPRNPDNPLLRRYRGTPAFAPDPAFVLDGRYVPFRSARPTTVGAAVAGLAHVYQAPGKLHFTLAGTAQTLTVFPGGAPGTVLALFTDATSGVSSYAANRALVVTAPAAGGPVRLDFNRAVNLPCAYSDLATCPLPPAENRLTAAITAGERTPHERGGAA